eukprot:GHVR01191098.1.p2 GENE.GHVR01191098.1~~GHVR01191098.1.p2  ORF type:complete len:121 (+),score=54.81 GHVR01191098.1:528-890(+)
MSGIKVVVGDVCDKDSYICNNVCINKLDAHIDTHIHTSSLQNESIINEAAHPPITQVLTDVLKVENVPKIENVANDIDNTLNRSLIVRIYSTNKLVHTHTHTHTYTITYIILHTHTHTFE